MPFLCRGLAQVEGLYKNFGDTAKLRDLIALKKKYFYRLFVDETFSFGCFGRGESWLHGRAPARSRPAECELETSRCKDYFMHVAISPSVGVVTFPVLPP